MVVAALDAATDGRADDERRGVFAARAVAHLGQLVDDLIVGRVDEVGELDLGHRPHAVEGHSDGRADDAGFGQRRVDTALGAELLEEARGGPKYATETTDVLAQDQHAWVAAHLG